MLTAAENFINFIKAFMASCLSVLKVLFAMNAPYSLPAKTKEFASILGNGPSLNDSIAKDMEYIKTTDAYCVNQFAMANVFEQIKPGNYVLLDPAYFQKVALDAHRPYVQEMIQCLVAKTTWQLYLFVPKKAKGLATLLEISKNPNIEIVYFNYTIVKGLAGVCHWFYRHHLGFIQSQTVLVAALFLAVNRGYKKIFLFGADSSFHENITISQDNTLSMKQFHFYEKAEEVKSQVVQDISKKNPKVSIAAQFAALYKTFVGYENLEKYAKSRGVDILNASTKSYIDAFVRVKIDS